MNNPGSIRIEILKSYLKEDPEDSFSAYALSLEYAKMNNSVEAISLLEEILHRDPEYLAAYYQLGKLAEEQRDFEKASSVYRKGMEVAKMQKDQKTLNELQSACDLLDD